MKLKYLLFFFENSLSWLKNIIAICSKFFHLTLFFKYITRLNFIIHLYKNNVMLFLFFLLFFILFIDYEILSLLGNNLLFLIFFVNINGILFLIFIPGNFKRILRSIAIFTTSIIYFISIFLWLFFDRSTPKFQYMFDLGSVQFLNTNLVFGIDGFSIFLVLLTSLISPLLILCSWYIEIDVKLLTLVILISELFTLMTFTALDLFVFFLVFEGLLLPLFISIVLWGSSDRKIKAALMLFTYTIFSSLLFSIAIFTIYLEVGTTNFFSVFIYSKLGFSFFKQKFLWCLLFVAFAIKLPLYPFHTWLPEAHVEAPTFGSVILASLLLKTGGYGLFRFVIPMFVEANLYFTPLVYTLGLIGVIYGALSSIRQLDVKRIIAYLSVSHMNFCVLGQFSENLEGILGSLLLMIAHGIIAAGLFISVGFLYKRYEIRNINYYGGLARVMPIFATLTFIFTLGNMNMPGTSNFVGELLILVGISHISLYVTLFAAVGSAIGALCSIWLWTKIMFGNVKTNYLLKFKDLTRKEYFTLLPLVLINFSIGIYTNEYIDTIYASVYFLYTTILI